MPHRSRFASLTSSRIGIASLIAAFACSGCVGDASWQTVSSERVGDDPDSPGREVTDPDDPGDPDPVDPDEPVASDASTHGTRRLSRRELANTLEALTGVRPESLETIPPDSKGKTFDRHVDAQTMSRSHLDGFLTVARDVGTELIASRTLDRVGSACPPEIVPPAATSRTERFIGASLGVGPSWSIQIVEADPTVAHSLYSPTVTVAHTHAFPAPGDYEVVLSLRIPNTQSRVSARVDDVEVHSEGGLEDSVEVRFDVTRDVDGPAALSFVVEETGGGNHSVFVEALSIRGPIDRDAEALAGAREACAISIVDELAPLAFRRPLSPSRRDDLLELYRTYAREESAQFALVLLFQAILANPNTLYLLEYGEPHEDAEGVQVLDDWELAARLSYAVCEMPPDETLRSLAAEGRLAGDPVVLREQVERLFGLPCARHTIRYFFEQWLWLDRLEGLNKDADAFPTFDDATREGLREEARWFIDELFWERDATLSDFFTTRDAWVHPDSAHLYDEGEGATAGEQVLSEQRVGILSRPPVLAVTGEFDATSPVHRGVYVLEQVLCEHLVAPPDDLEVAPPPPDPGLTTQERWAQHSSEPSCAGCHSLIDPIGFVFESYDGVGVWRTHENGMPIDTTGGAPSIGLARGSVSSVAQLSSAFTESPVLAACFANQWLRFSLGREEGEADARELSAMADALESGSMKEALIGLLASSIVTTRMASPEQEGEE